MSDERPLNPQAEAAIAKVRRLMLIVSVTTFLAVAAVLGVIGYRLMSIGGKSQGLAQGLAQGRAQSMTEATAALPAGAKVISTAVGDNHIVVTIELGGTTEIRTFDAGTLKPLGRLRLERKP